MKLILFFSCLFTFFFIHSQTNDVFHLGENNKDYGDYFIGEASFLLHEDSTFLINEKSILTQIFQPLVAKKHDTYKANNWVKFSVKNDLDIPRVWTIVHADPHAFHYKLFELTQKNELKLINEAGTGIPFHKRAKPFHSFSCDLIFKPGETKTFYAWYAPGAYYNFKYCFHTPRFAESWELTEYTYLGVFYGFLIFAFLYSLIMFFVLKSNIYGIYSLYILACVFYFSHHNLLLFQHVFPNFPFINEFAQHTKGLLLTIAFYFYFNHFNTSETHKNCI